VLEAGEGGEGVVEDRVLGLAGEAGDEAYAAGGLVESWIDQIGKRAEIWSAGDVLGVVSRDTSALSVGSETMAIHT
jgi:hypothetical protein